jgi:acid phosphatase family membrane protein YuiD
MGTISAIIGNHIILSCVLAWAIAQAMKIVLELILEKKFDIERLTGSGGMPSSHSAFVVALAVAIGMREGYNSAIFALATGFACVVMYDAAGVRRAAGKQATVINALLLNFSFHDEIADEKLKELVGHTPIEVIAGAVLGCVVAIIIGV